MIQARDLEARVAILQKKAEQNRFVLSREVALYIARKFHSNAGALDEALDRLKAYSLFNGTELTLAYTQRVLKSLIDLQPRELTAESAMFGLLKISHGTKSDESRLHLEVNMREREREHLVRRDGYERELERKVFRMRKRG